MTTIYHRPRTLSEALALRAGDPGLTVMAGGTDLFPVMTQQAAWFGQTPASYLDLTAIAELSGVTGGDDGLRFGALTPWSTLAQAALPPGLSMLRQAARQVGGVQIQNRGTIGGNLCNASPAADGAPPLLALDAEVELASSNGQRRLPLSQFLLGNRRTALRPDELLVAVHLPHQPDAARSTFLKLGARAYLVISIASVAATLSLAADGRIASARIAVGACSAVPQRLPALEARLAGAPCTAALADLVEASDLTALTPIDDVRASAAYRQAAALTLVRRALTELALSPMEAVA